MGGLRSGRLALPRGGGQLGGMNPETAPVAQAVGGGVTYHYVGAAVDIQMAATGAVPININATGDFLWRATGVLLRLNEEITLASQVFPKGYVIPHRPFAASLAAASWGVPGCITMGNFRAAYSFGKESGMNLPVPLDQIAGNAQSPFFLPTPFRIPANTAMVWSITNDIIASTAFSGLASAKVNAWVTLIGESL